MEEFDEDLIYEESEMMNYKLTANTASIEKGIVCLNTESPSYTLAKYTVSDAIASSVKLGIWEASLGRQLFLFCVIISHIHLLSI